ncbi:MAG: glutamate--tRNA ligase [Euryarchaeota archaeon]|nr:glutamate--tRNA ligase [Euryarchaeota archaeon]
MHVMVQEQEVRTLARKYALQNAVQHGGKANPGAVVGRIMGGAPEYRAASKEVMPIIHSEVGVVNAMDAVAQKAELEALDPSLLEKKKRERGHPFKTLPRFEEHDTIVMRFAPNPNGPATLGHSRGMVTMSEYKRIAEQAGKKGVLVLRFDDTDPQVKPPYPPAYKWIEEDYGWLGEKPDRVVAASSRNEEYYKVAEALIEKGAAYVCSCPKEKAKEYRDAGKPCPHRERPTGEDKADWARMVAGEMAEGAATLRIKTEVAHKDPAQRDWVGFRIVKTPHPVVGDKYNVWPMLDFESAVEDHLQGVTHIIRGKDLQDSTRRQKYLYQHMGWTYPETLYWGRVQIDEVGKFSSSGMRRDIEAGKYSGWDDPRLPTLRALRRRGIKAEALRAFWVGMGLSEKDVAASLMNLYAESAKILEPTADRYFFVNDPVEVRLEVPDPEVGELVAKSLVHPDRPERGVRTNRLSVAGGVGRVILSRRDLLELDAGDLVRLKDLGNVRVRSLELDDPVVVWEGTELDAARKARAAVVEWLPAAEEATCPMVVLRPEPDESPEGLRHRGRVERAVLEAEPGSVVQFERYGYCRLERVDGGEVLAVYAHR